MNFDDFSYTENDRRYINPQVSLDEQNAFIQNLRDTQGVRNAQIAQQTHNLGTDVPSNLGGLTGSEAYFNARYQTPQTNNIVGELKAAAQAQALSDAMSNELAKAKKLYNDAYRAYKKRNGGNGGNTGGNNDDDDDKADNIEYGNDEGETYQYEGRTIEGNKVDEEASKKSVFNPEGEAVVEGHTEPVFNVFQWIGDMLSGKEQNRQAWKKYASDRGYKYSEDDKYYYIYYPDGTLERKGRL